MDPFKILNKIIDKYKNILDENLVGIYLHGSLAMGCYNPSSDIDFLVVVNKPIQLNVKKELINVILHLEDVPPKGIEMSIILEKYAQKIVYPTPFELHYSNFHRDRYLSDHNYVCGDSEDPDLAAQLNIVVHRGVCLYGKEIDEVFNEVPREVYINSIHYDVRNAKSQILEDPVYIILNLCRVLNYLKENVICSKLEGGEWGKENLPQKYRILVEDAVKVYMDDLSEFYCSHQILIEFAEYMLNEIQEMIERKKIHYLSQNQMES
ncbi:aminoglycoside adenylyltransferase domain-containing protein [Chengkuizengella sp. SCS-71B]|uniref:aminoglycoside adenylyltransferase domain-containing protein n=1 Tax=Chengkuizengella sp. SCS-71B TaxID=3115290 RepID=UPI0032C21152